MITLFLYNNLIATTGNRHVGFMSAIQRRNKLRVKRDLWLSGGQSFLQRADSYREEACQGRRHCAGTFPAQMEMYVGGQEHQGEIASSQLVMSGLCEETWPSQREVYIADQVAG